MKPPDYVKSAVVDQDRLAAIRDQLRAARDLSLEIGDLEQVVKSKKESLREIERSKLVDLFQTAGINQLGLEPEGNLPAYEAKLAPYYKANISADWDPERKAAAFNWLDKNKAGDLVKATITIRLPLDSQKMRKKITVFLRKLKVEFTEDLSVPWTTLTAYVRESITKRHTMPPLDVLGADVGHVVKLKEKKDG